MTWFDLVKLEGLALWRSRLLALHPVIAFGFATVLLGGNPVDVAAMVPPLTTAILIVQLPILVLVLAPSVTGTWSQKGDCLWLTAAGLPVVAAARLAAAVVSISLLLLPVIVAMGIILGWRSGDVVAGGMQLTVAFGRLLFPVTWAQIALVHALAHLLRRTVWVAVLCLVPTVFVSLGSLVYTQSFLHPFNYGWIALSFDTVQGIGADGPFQAKAAGLMVLAALSLWGVSILMAPRQDERVGWKPGVDLVLHGSVALALGLLVAGSFLFRTAAQRNLVPKTETAQIDSWEVLSSFHRIHLDGDAVTVESHLKLQSTASPQQEPPSVDLALNTGFSVHSALLNGQSVPVRRKGEAVALIAPHEILSLPTEVDVAISYSGKPVLLREDYGDVVSVPYLPPRFRHSTVGHMGPSTLYWTRDSDWLVWPLSPYPHIAQEINQIEMSVAPTSARFPLFSTAGSVGIDPAADSRQLHVWTERIPAFLMASGPYRREGSDSGDLYLGRFQLVGETEIARQYLAWSEELNLSGGNPPDEMTLAVIPYGTKILFADAYVLVPEERLRWHFPEGLKEAPSQQQQYLAGAIRLVADWLSEKIAWEQEPMIFHGVARGIREGYWEFPNPQAPFLRWIPNPTPRAWQQAFAIVLTHRVLFAANPELIRAERAAWEYQRDIVGSIVDPGTFLKESILIPYVPPVGNEEDMDFCALAYAVSAVHGAVDAYGTEFLWKWLAALALESAQGRVKISEDVVWKIGSELADGVMPPPPNAECKVLPIKT